MENSEKTCVIATPTLTAALRAESLLKNAGIFARVVKLPAGSTKKGCAYGVQTGALFLQSAQSILEKAGVTHGETLCS